MMTKTESWGELHGRIAYWIWHWLTFIWLERLAERLAEPWRDAASNVRISCGRSHNHSGVDFSLALGRLEAWEVDYRGAWDVRVQLDLSFGRSIESVTDFGGHPLLPMPVWVNFTWRNVDIGRRYHGEVWAAQWTGRPWVFTGIDWPIRIYFTRRPAPMLG